MRLGISSYTFVWAVGVPGSPQPAQPLTAEGLLAKAAQLGVSVVQIADNLPLDRLTPAEIDRLWRRAAELQIDLEVGTRGIQPAHLRTFLSLAIKLRSPLLRTLIEPATAESAADNVVAALREVIPEFSRSGVCLATENHDFLRAQELAQIVDRCKSQSVGICLDTANSLGCGEDIH